MTQKRFQVALSFPGDKREYVSQVAEHLGMALGKDKVFYDEWHTAELARPNLDTHLQSIYQDAALVVPFLSADYERKQWCKLEWRAIRDLIMRLPDEVIMPLRFDDTHIPGLFSTDGYVDLRSRTPRQVADYILQRVKMPVSIPAFQPRIDIARLPPIQGTLFGRADELAKLDEAWANPQTRIFCLTAWGGQGKSMLVQAWLQRLRRQQWGGAQVVFCWSFYSRNAAKEWRVSADQFFNEALAWFGHSDSLLLSPWLKGETLARLVAQTRTLLVLDGLESLQEATGELREQGMKALLRQLGNEDSQGLCLITSRIPFRDVTYADSAAVVHHHLGVLPSDAAVELLKDKGVKGTDTAFDQVVADLQGHALSLTLFGNLLVELYGGDLGKRRKLPPIVRENPVRSVMGFYESRFKDKPELLFLYLMGLFDRAMFMPTLKALLKSAKKRWQMPALRGSYEAVFAPLMRLDDAGLRRLLAHLKKLELLVDAQPSKADLPSGQSLEARAYDCHPLIHEYFAQRFKQQWPTAWRQAHERLYHYYQSLPEKTCPDTLDELEPLFVAVTHGCQAGKPQQALDEVYLPRIRRDDEAYLSSVLGAIPMSLAVLSNFFASPWAEPLPQLGDESKAKVLGWAGFRLRALGRLETAKKPLALSLAMYEGWRDWQGAAEAASDLASLYLVLGQISTAFGYAQTAVRYADDLGDLREQSMRRTTLADVCHQMGKLEDAERYFGEAEAIHSDNPGEGCRFLHGLWGFRHCDLLLTQGRWREVLERAGEVQKVNHGKQKKLDMALNKLMFGRAYLAQAQASGSTEQAVIQQARESIYAAVEDLRAANENHHLPKGFLACAQLHRLLQDHVSAAGNLASAKAISTRRQGNMRLYLTDYHLESARLALDLKQMSRVQEHVQAADKLIAETGYKRRLPELWELQTLVGNADVP